MGKLAIARAKRGSRKVYYGHLVANKRFTLNFTGKKGKKVCILKRLWPSSVKKNIAIQKRSSEEQGLEAEEEEN